jgi:hypothetical protein
MSKLWEKRRPPVPIDFDALIANSSDVEEINTNNSMLSTQRVWSIKECFEYFCQSVEALKKKLNDNEILVWDKVKYGHWECFSLWP